MVNSICFLGPIGSFSHQAATMITGEKELIPKGTITDVFNSINDKECHEGLVPIENSLEGPVNETLDNLFYKNLFINLEIEVPINLVLASKNDKFNIVYSHPHAIQECRDYIVRKSLDKVIPVESTSRAAELASVDPNAAAICSEMAARIYNLRILDRNIEDNVNITRFFLISRKETKEGNKSSLIFTVPHTSGSLYHVLGKFYEEKINLSMIYSRPLKSIPWRYYFYVEYEGNKNERLLEKLREVTTSLSFKGSYSKFLNNNSGF
ncbi:Prephenate dehydratase [Sulfuracidifex tepidarius]|uniref:Prephenate dehydratase n=1 Tax=Sulfuracidifex tepidarius TaxID=1294262 RepID=A0A510DW86_9CREN|nr:prephenate dehydratase [Sulfuracidifex tepidarius]BBG24486.1 Prephenate dehydratase [Sulfuracidifex tepidarius]